jgi:hypothetical protein
MSNKDPEDRQEDLLQEGEFTRFFNGAKPAVDPSEQATTIQSVPPLNTLPRSPGVKDQPGVEPKPNPVKLPRVQRPPSNPVGLKFPTSTSESSSGPGEFTRLFNMPPAAKTGDRPAAPKPLPEGESEFTRFFKAPQLPNAREVDWNKVKDQPPPPPPAKSDGTFTDFFGRTGNAGAVRKEAERNPPGPVQRSGSSLEEAPFQADEFAKVVAPRARSSGVASAGTGPAAAPISENPVNASAQTKPGASFPALIILIAAVLILAVFAIYYFVVR